ncbi:unnamed protein product [Lathyrus oleraceus]
MPTGEENITYLPETKIGDRSRCASVDDEIFNRIWSKKSEQEVVCHQGLLIHLTIAEPNASMMRHCILLLQVSFGRVLQPMYSC